MTTWGLSTAGFTKKRLADIQSELEASLQATFGAEIKVSGDSVFGQLIGIMADREAELWELAEAVYLSAYPDSAAGTPLDNAAALTGHSRQAATHSNVTVTCATTGGSPVILPVGRQVRVTATGATFETLEEVTIPAGGNVEVSCRATVTGPVEAPAGTLTEIVTPVSGWTSVTNAADAAVGRDQETDAAFRTRRLEELSVAQGGTIAAMENRITNEVSGVTFCVVQENRTDTTDGDGRPPHSVHVTVIGGTNQDVADMIWATKPAGAAMHGATTATVVDSAGNNQTVKFDRATSVRIYLIANLTTDGSYPADGDDLVAAALAAFDADLENGDDLLNWQLVGALAGIPGILTVQILQGTSSPPVSSANTSIAANEVASIALADITVNS